MEQKLNMIYEKLVELDTLLRRENLEIKLKEIENEKRELKCKEEDTKRNIDRLYDYENELLSTFRTINIQKEN